MTIIDVSAWQGDDYGNSTVDWDGLITEGIEGVIIKIGEGAKLDEAFIDHANQAVAHGLKIGIYYYGHACTPEEAQQEAQQVEAWVDEYLNGSCPALGIWYDAESQRMLEGDTTAICSTFISYLNGIGYKYVGIYSSWNWLSSEGSHYIHMEELEDYVPYWVAQYGNPSCSLAEENPEANIRFWQYTDHYSDDLPYDASISID